MSDNNRRVAILAEGSFNVYAAKTAVGVIRYSSNPVVAVIDSENAGKTVQDVLGFGGDIPIVASMAEAMKFEPEALIIGIAPTGGRLPGPWRRVVSDAIEARVDVWSGLHSFLADDEEFQGHATARGVKLWDVRRPRPDLVVADGKALSTRALVVLAVGTDCNIGKMTVCLELQKVAREKGYKAGFVATGQTGILIDGDGTPLDAVPGDFMPGEVERLVMDRDAEGCDVIFVEGQGAITHPGFGPVTLGLMLGAMPDAYVLCHQPGRVCYRPSGVIPIPDLPTSVNLYENLMRQYKAPKVVAAGLNTFGLSDDEAAAAAADVSSQLGVPAADPIRDGAEKLWEAIEPLLKAKLAQSRDGAPAELQAT
jgi:uncharacterized NAD-dependent epimerase/dehydratase family protein